MDAFNAIAEVKRRELLEILADQPLAVNDIVGRLGWPQPMVSKHLGVLREVGLVQVERQSRRKIYSMNAEPLKAVHEWTRHFERFWGRHLQSIKARAEAKARAAQHHPSKRSTHE